MLSLKDTLTETAVDIIKIVQPVDIRTLGPTTSVILADVIPGGVAGKQNEVAQF